MKIYTNEGNPFGLNLLMLTKFARKDVSVEKIKLKDAIAKDMYMLPTLELDNGSKIFSLSAAARYLLKNEPRASNEWLEWSITLLAPALVHTMATGHRADSTAIAKLNFMIKKLECRLKKSSFLASDTITAADIAVWSLFAPEGTLRRAESAEHFLSWFWDIGTMPEVKAALAEMPSKNINFNSLQDSNRYNGFYHVSLTVQLPTNAENVLAEAGSNLPATLSEEELEEAKSAFVYTAAVQSDKEPRTVLPKAGERNVLVTSALPYVNNVPHLGNIIGCVLSADIFARYSRAVGYNTLYICGTDEYGTATENKALAEKLTPKEICDKYFELHNGIYRWFGIGFDFFGRTTLPEQTEIVQEAFKDVFNKGYILKESVEQLLCQNCDRFLADRFVEGTCPHPGCGYEDARGDQCDKCGKLVNATDLIRPRCKVCNTAPVLRKSDQLFLDLTSLQPKLCEWFERTESGWSQNARNITRAWITEGLKPRCITRDLKWGIPVPHEGFENKVFYVWFDAVFGYVSMTKRYTKDYQKWWQPAKDTQVELFQFMAKDNVPFHSVVWPSILLAIDKGHTIVSHLMATEYLNYEGGKFSKSRGIGVFGNDAQDTGISSDVWRFYLASARPEGQDSNFSWNDLAARNNSELLNNLGNFVNRGLVFCDRNFDGKIPEITLTQEEVVLLALINRELRGYVNSLEKAKLRDGIRHLLAISRLGNGYIQSQEPWKLAKGTNIDKARAATINGVCCNIVCLLANLLFPYMPSTARKIFEQLNTQQALLNADKPLTTILLPPGHKIGKPAPLFAKLEDAYIDELKKKYGADLVAGEKQQAVVNKTTLNSVAELEKAIQVQGDLVRKLKADKKEKTVWGPEVNKLIDLKDQLKALQNAALPNGEVTELRAKLDDLEERISAQGDKVRRLKATADVSVWKPEVEVLVSLKKELMALTGGTPAETGKSKKKK